MKKTIRKSLPPIGMRIVKSAAAILLCYLISFLRGDNGIVFYSQLAALWCIQMYAITSRKNAIQRFIGTCIGAIFGLIYLLVRNQFEKTVGFNKAADAIMISLLVIVVLYTTVLIKRKQASYFSCVVFLSIVVNHVTDTNPYLFVWNRFLDTVIGIVIGIGINSLSLPREKRKDILFISGLDDTLLNKKEALTDYSKVELNRMLDDGANFTVSTMRTPAYIMDSLRDIRLKLPVIAMDGAVLYDINENQYLKVYVISHDMAANVNKLLQDEHLSSFTNVIIDDMLVIYYDETGDSVHEALIKKMRRSPYRNYVKMPLPKNQEVVYFMLLYPHDVIEKIYKKFEEQGFTDELKFVKYASSDYPGYSYLKIYNKNATKENMIDYLKNMTGLTETVTFGSVEDKYDIVVNEGDSNKVVHMLKKLYEPVKMKIPS